MRRFQRRVLVLAWETWFNAAAAAASVVAHQVILRQHSERLQRRSVAAGFESWAGAADCRRQQRRLAKRAAARIRVCTLSAAWNGWADEAAAPAAEDEEDPLQAPNIPPPPSLSYPYSSKLLLMPFRSLPPEGVALALAAASGRDTNGGASATAAEDAFGETDAAQPR